MMKKICIYIFVFAAVLLVMPQSSKAEASSSFFVYPEYPQNQIEPDTGYFYISMQPGGTQTLTIGAVNNSDTAITLYAETADAYTSPDGALVYVTRNTSNAIGYNDESFMMSGNLKLSAGSLELAPGETKKLQIIVTAPSPDNVEAIGAVRLYTMEAGPGVSAGVDVSVKSAQTIPVRIRTGQPAAQTGAAVDIGDVTFDSAQKQYYFTAANTLPQINKLDKLSVAITDPAGSEVYSRSLSSLKMAPKTYFRAYLDWADSSTLPGTYTASISTVFGGNTESVARQFTIEAAQASELPQATATQEAAPGGIYISTPLFMIIGTVVIVIFVLLALLITRRNKR